MSPSNPMEVSSCSSNAPYLKLYPLPKKQGILDSIRRKDDTSSIASTRKSQQLLPLSSLSGLKLQALSLAYEHGTPSPALSMMLPRPFPSSSSQMMRTILPTPPLPVSMFAGLTLMSCAPTSQPLPLALTLLLLQQQLERLSHENTKSNLSATMAAAQVVLDY
ncbi:hypothetical protein ARMSODRAFT_1017289 [Armillaria solidipes]|uniref:Uncharacterized protein n=1 Tax=Armillaria solidipes TaxID=1076256 RepID=A0A2H3C7X3_9AGAR|nr:hypothetical protein ARMSODRAFT_1017289 [Armillaria solidipes]